MSAPKVLVRLRRFAETAPAEVGNPYGFSTKAGALDDAGKAAVTQQAKRLVELTGKLV